MKCGNDPIPKELQFEHIDDFIKPLDTNTPTESINVQDSLIPQFKDSLKKVNVAIAAHKKNITKVTKRMNNQNIFSKYHIQPSFLTQDIYRQYKFLQPIVQNLYLTLQRTRSSLIEQQIEMLINIQKVITYLIHHPKPVYVNVVSITQPFNIIEFSYLSSVQYQYYIYKRKMKQLISQLTFIPHPFPDKHSSIQLLRKIINDSIILKDPSNQYIPETDEYEIFSRFLQSQEALQSKFCLSQLNERNFVDTLEFATRETCRYIGITVNETDQTNVIRYFLARFLFNTSEMLSVNRNDQYDEKLLIKMKEMKICEMGIKESQIPSKYLEMTSNEFCDNYQLFNGIFDDLLLCCFCTFPIDALYILSKVELRIKTMIEECSNEVKNENLFAGWEIIIVAAQLPLLKVVFDRMEKWKSLNLVSNELTTVYEIPKLVMEEINKGCCQ